MIIMYLFILALFVNGSLILGEHYAVKNPEKGFTKWWRYHIISDTHDED